MATAVEWFLIIAVPLFWILITSFKERQDIYVRPAQWWPDPATKDNYVDVTTRIAFWSYLRNSVIITIATATANTVGDGSAGSPSSSSSRP